ncbi:hypothetical protein NMY22_g8197 [Coprinellus aureogranulatus]|nr:hypothetical protein NMY22_g8197 [Coprinellus aureogranulatus]
MHGKLGPMYWLLCIIREAAGERALRDAPNTPYRPIVDCLPHSPPRSVHHPGPKRQCKSEAPSDTFVSQLSTEGVNWEDSHLTSAVLNLNRDMKVFTSAHLTQ